MLRHITTPLSYNGGFHTVRQSIAFLLLFTPLYIDGQPTTMGDGLKHEHICFKTVTHFYSNPGVTGDTALQFTYKNDELQTEQLNLTCGDQDEELFIELKSVVLSLPSQGDKSHYCGESTENSYKNCKQASQCDCCRRPAERCTDDVLLEEYQDCNRQKNCLLTVTSKYLQDCPTIDYSCDGKRCHSRWADVTYACRPKDAIPTQPPMHKGAGGPLTWWHIFLIIGGVLLVVVFLIFLYRRKKYSDRELMPEPSGGKVEDPLWTENDYAEPTAVEYTQIDKTKKKQKSQNCDAADVTDSDQQRKSLVRIVDNDAYSGFDRNSTRERDSTVYSTDNEVKPKSMPKPPPASNKPKTTSKPPPPPPPQNSKPTVSNGHNKNEALRPNQQQQQQNDQGLSKPQQKQKPTMLGQPPKPRTSEAQSQKPATANKPTVSSQPAQHLSPLRVPQEPPKKPPRLSDTDSPKSPMNY